MKLNEVIAKYGNQEVDESKIKEVLGVKESKVWVPKEGEEVWIIYSDGDLGITESNIQRRLVFGNLYKTKEEAEFARDKQIFLTKFERYLRENEDEVVDFKNEYQRKWCVWKLSNNHLSTAQYVDTFPLGLIMTTNLEALQRFIQINESDIKKYMFGVE